MAMDVAEYLWNKFLKSLAELESESRSGSITISLDHSIKDVIKSFNNIKDIMKERDIMPEPYTYSDIIDVLYNLNDVLAECRIFTAECNELIQLNKNLLSFNFPRMNFVKKMKNKVKEITEKLAPGDPQEGSGGSPGITETEEMEEPPSRESDKSQGKPENREESDKSLAKTEPEIFGFETESKKIEDLLVQGASSTAIGVTGVAGVGKTTLVMEVLKRKRVKEKFGPILWLPFHGISEGEQQYSKLGFKTCIQYKQGDSKDGKTPKDIDGLVGVVELLDSLKQQVSGKRYLIVLDDVCHRHINIMERLVSGLPKDCAGSVIVTSRLKEVARKIGDQPHLVTVPVQKDVCSQIIEKIIPSSDESLSSLKKKLKDQCHGLPLVAKTLADFIPV